MPHRRRRGTKKKNRQGDLKTKVKPKASLIPNKRNTVCYKDKEKGKHNKYYYNQNSRPTGEEEGATRFSQKAKRGTPPYRPPTLRHRRGRPSLRGEGQQQKVKEARHTYTHMHYMQHTCHEHDACERTGHTSAQQYTYTHPDTGKQFIYQIKSHNSQSHKKTRKEQNKLYKSRVTYN